MRFHIITIFPESFESYIHSSIFWRTVKKKKIELFFYKLNDFSDKNYKQVDDKWFGMAGQVISPEPLSKAIERIFLKLWHKVPVVYFTPSGELLNQQMSEKLSEDFLDQDVILICGHYEWIDQRICDLYVTHEISIGEYVLTSWELAAMVFCDSLIRHIPWVLWNRESLDNDSFSKNFSRKKEYPVYTRPREFMWISVPGVLVSWDHARIEEWKQQSLR